MTHKQEQPQHPTSEINVDSGAAAAGDGSTAVGERSINAPNSNISSPIITGDNNQLTFNQTPFTPTLDPQQRRNRENYLNNLYVSRIEGMLHKSLYTEVLIELDKEYKPEAVSRTWGVVLKQEDQPDEEIPPETPIYDIFVRHGRSLLILGEPGSGKSTVLLQLAEQLIKEAREDEAKPMPVFVNLSSWARERTSLIEWLVIEMNMQYQVPLPVGQMWLEDNRFILLLDGLDEVAAEQRDMCIDAINTFQENYSNEIVVCARIKDYERLTRKFNLSAAINLKPLTQEQIDQYLSGYSSDLEAVRIVLPQDKQLQELVQTPLMLSIAVLAYRGLRPEQLTKMMTVERRRIQLFDRYVATMFEKRPLDSELYNYEQALSWLKLIAYNLQEQNLSEFYIERMQAVWLETDLLQRRFKLFAGLNMGLLVGLIATLIVWIILGLYAGIIFGLFAGITVGFIAAQEHQIKVIDTISWAKPSPKIFWRHIRQIVRNPTSPLNITRKTKLTSAMIFVVVFVGIFMTRINELDERVNVRIAAGVIFAIMGFFYGLSVEATAKLIAGLGDIVVTIFPTQIMEKKPTPNQGFWNSGKNSIELSLIFVFIFAFIGAITFGLAELMIGMKEGLVSGVMFGLNIGLSIGLLRYGGLTVIQHGILRYQLYHLYDFPLDKVLIPFMDDMTEHILLNRVGGGWTFKHRLLLEYFAAQYKPDRELTNG